MSEMNLITLAANGVNEPSGPTRDSLMLLVTGNFGGGTLAVQKYSKARAAFVTVASYTAATTAAQEIKVGRGRVQFNLTGATTPALDIDYWSM